ncbi:MAG: L,D-transpeptidase family protein [Propionibacteriales bacterium]|nr:L,D-transpeptidase family protein [Propionibacteriales bacterium]
MGSTAAQHRDPAGPSPQRLLAVGGAVAVTAIALAGSLGFGPGSVAGQEPRPEHTAQQPAGVDPASSQTGSTPSADTATSRQRSVKWLIDTHQRGSEAATEGAAPNAAQRSSTENPPAHHKPRSSGGGFAAATTALPADSGRGKRVVFDISAQRVWLVDDDDRVERTYLVSGSRHEDLLAPGSYDVFSKSAHAVSFDQKETMQYMVRFAYGDRSAIGFHDIPAYVSNGLPAQSRDDLGTPQSAGCIRQWESDAKALWRFADVGTTVVVTS